MDKISELQEYWREKREQMAEITDMIFHRLEYGSPILLQPGDDLGISPDQSMKIRQEAIKLRRKILGLPYEEWRR